MTWRSLFLIAGVALLLSGPPMLMDRVLTAHEAVLPQSARVMYLDGELAVPKRGEDAPWLESPPLPQWSTVALCTLAGSCEGAVVARLGAMLAGLVLVLSTAGMAGAWFGPGLGLLAGLVMATTYQVFRYASLAEDEIYLAAIVTAAVAVFARIEFEPARQTSRAGVFGHTFGLRHGLVLLLFVLLGMTNLAKGLAFGTVMALIPMALFLLATRDPVRIFRYVWFPGWLVFLAIAAAWPLTAWRRHPDVVDVWVYDLFGRMSGSYVALNEPWWYYALKVPEATAPWFLVVPFGLWATRRAARADASSPQRFLWIWALGVPLVLSFMSGKHHHYLLHGLAPWAVLAALGLKALGERFIKHAGRRRLAAGLAIASVAALGTTAQVLHRGSHHADGEFLREVAQADLDAPLLADLDVGGLGGFLRLVYLPPDTRSLHNLTYLRDAAITAPRVFLLTDARNADALERYGHARTVMQSSRERSPEEAGRRITLFELVFEPGLTRVPAPGRISPMQAMYRRPGPYLVVEPDARLEPVHQD